jgi:hypothetical protein
MPRPGGNEILALWEAGLEHSAARRALAMLECACPDRASAELARLPLGQRDALLLGARQRTLGETLEAVTDCPACGERVEVSLACAALIGKDEPVPFDPTLSVDGYELTLQLPGSADLIAIESCADVDEATAELTKRCIHSALRDGEIVAPMELPASVVIAAVERLAEGDPHSETLFALCCPACDENWSCELDVAGFFWKELRAHALRLLDDVHLLASAYGWNEAEILALSPARREWYLERVQP